MRPPLHEQYISALDHSRQPSSALVLGNSGLECKRSHPRCGANAARLRCISRASRSACSPRDISLRKDRIVYCSAVKSGRGAGGRRCGWWSYKIREERRHRRRKRERGREEEQGIKCRNVQQRHSGVNRWRSCVFLRREERRL